MANSKSQMKAVLPRIFADGRGSEGREGMTSKYTMMAAMAMALGAVPEESRVMELRAFDGPVRDERSKPVARTLIDEREPRLSYKEKQKWRMDKARRNHLKMAERSRR